MAANETKVFVIVQKGHVRLAELSTLVSDGRHEFVFANPINVNGRHFEGFSLEMWLDREPRHVSYTEYLANRNLITR